MHLPTTLLLSLTAALASAQSTTIHEPPPPHKHPYSGCGLSIDITIDLCLDTTKLLLNKCDPDDLACLCFRQTHVALCYNNCPVDPRAPAADAKRHAFCTRASAAGYPLLTAAQTHHQNAKPTSVFNTSALTTTHSPFPDISSLHVTWPKATTWGVPRTTTYTGNLLDLPSETGVDDDRAKETGVSSAGNREVQVGGGRVAGGLVVMAVVGVVGLAMLGNAWPLF